MHEHVFVLSPEILQNHPELWDEEERVTDAVDQAQRARRRAGIDSIVDPTVIGLGRYIPRVQLVAEQTELNIVAATGPLHVQRRALLLPTARRARGDTRGPGARWSAMFVKDITEGIADTGVKAGIIKCATDEGGLTPGVERVLRACARAHRQTGVPITTHTDVRHLPGAGPAAGVRGGGRRPQPGRHRPLRRLRPTSTTSRS